MYVCMYVCIAPTTRVQCTNKCVQDMHSLNGTCTNIPSTYIQTYIHIKKFVRVHLSIDRRIP